jgi:hypothetical protein
MCYIPSAEDCFHYSYLPVSFPSLCTSNVVKTWRHSAVTKTRPEDQADIQRVKTAEDKVDVHSNVIRDIHGSPMWSARRQIALSSARGICDTVHRSQCRHLWVYNSAVSVTVLQILQLIQCLQASDNCLFLMLLTITGIIVLRSINWLTSLAETKFSVCRVVPECLCFTL